MRRTTASTSAGLTWCCRRNRPGFGIRAMAIIGRLSFDGNEILARPVRERVLEAAVRHAADPRGLFTTPARGLAWRGATPDTGASPVRTAAPRHSRAR